MAIQDDSGKKRSLLKTAFAAVPGYDRSTRPTVDEVREASTDENGNREWSAGKALSAQFPKR